jgi:hypothetical protein
MKKHLPYALLFVSLLFVPPAYCFALAAIALILA